MMRTRGPWGAPASEYRQIARDCAAMGNPELALGFLALAEQEERQARAMEGLFGFSHASAADTAEQSVLARDTEKSSPTKPTGDTA